MASKKNIFDIFEIIVFLMHRNRFIYFNWMDRSAPLQKDDAGHLRISHKSQNRKLSPETSETFPDSLV